MFIRIILFWIFVTICAAQKAFDNCNNFVEKASPQISLDLNFVYNTKQSIRFNLTNKSNSSEDLFLYLICSKNGLCRINLDFQDDEAGSGWKKPVLKYAPNENEYKNLDFEADRAKITLRNGNYFYFYENPFVIEFFGQNHEQILKIDELVIINSKYFSVKLSFPEVFRFYKPPSIYNKSKIMNFEALENLIDKKCTILKNKTAPIVYPYSPIELAGIVFNNEEGTVFQLFQNNGKISRRHQIKKGLLDLFILSGPLLENIVEQYFILMANNE